jgi:predicted nucleotidyltransferase component of viral defense system
MLTVQQLRQTAAQNGVRDITFVEIDVVLTHLLQLFYEQDLTAHLAFKGGTFLRKMIFGPRGRLSTDLDFTCRLDMSRDELMLQLLDALEHPYRGISFRFDRDKDWYLTEEGFAANPVCFHDENSKGVKIKIQVSTRATPIMPVAEITQVEQGYFRLLGFQPAAIASLATEEVIAEKIRAASQRSKIRDLYDLAEISRGVLNKDLIRALAVLKLWESGKAGLDFQRLCQRIQSSEDYDVQDLQNLLRKDQKPDLERMIHSVCSEFRFLENLTERESRLAADTSRRLRNEAEELRSQLRDLS